jgi:hypothetical protein
MYYLPVVDPNAIFTLEQTHILKRINMVANSGFAAFALIGNVLIKASIRPCRWRCRPA